MRTGCRLDASGPQQLGRLFCCHRPAEKITLRLFATGAQQEAHLRLGLHPLGDDLEPKLIGEPDGGPDHGGV